MERKLTVGEVRGPDSRARPYASAALGRVISRLRRKRSSKAISTDAAGKILDIGGSTLRMVESGSSVVPIAIGLGLVREFGLSLAPTLEALGFAITVDRNRELAEMIAAAKLMAGSEPRLAFFATAVVEAAGLDLAGDPNGALLRVQDPRLTERLIRFLQEPAIGGGIDNGVLELPSQIAHAISPIYFDSIAAFAANLTDLPIHLGGSSLDKWELKNANRIVRVFTYQTNPKLLSTSSDTFHWEFLWRKGVTHKRRFVIVAEDSKSATEAGRELAASLVDKSPIGNRVEDAIYAVQDPPQVIIERFKQMLYFDPQTRTLKTPEQCMDPTKLALLNNLLLYELDAPSPFFGTVLVGFVDNAAPVSIVGDNEPMTAGRQDYYAVALSSADVSEARSIFRDAYPDV